MITEAGAKRDFKDRLYAEFARIGKAIASPHRLEILDVVAQGERTVESLAAETGLSVANASRHLQQLRQAQLVLARRDGLFVHYRLAGPEVLSLTLALRRVGEEHLAEVDRVVRDFFGEREGFEPVTPDELAQLMSNGEIVLLDVRSEHEYAAGHIAGARSMPVADIEARLGELPRNQNYVAYCRGPYCVYADEAVALLRANGLEATRLSDGYPEWWLAGRPVRVDRPDETRREAMKRLLTVGYGAVSYVIFLAAFLYAIGFVGNFLVPRTIDAGVAAPIAEAIIVNLLLLSLFAVQHSVMARPAFKRWWTRFVAPSIERSTYVLLASLALFVLYWQWRTMPAVIWDVSSSAGRVVLWALFCLGWATVLASTFMINHFDLFGLRQVYLSWRGKPYSDLVFRTLLLYRLVRHPIMLGFIVAFWATPT